VDYQIIDRADDFHTLAPHWQQLAAAGGVPTPYQSFAWIEQWLLHRRADVEPFVVLLRDGENETLAPFGRAGTPGLRQLSMLGAPDSDYVGLITTRPLNEAWDAVARVLAERRRSFDLVHLQSVREREPIVSALKRHLPGRGRERAYELCPWIPTDRSWEEVRKSRGNGLRNELKRWDRRIRELGQLEIEHVCPPLTAELVGELEEVERDSWKWEQGESAFRPGSQREFLEALLRDPRADMAVWLMRLSGRLVAYALVLVGKDRWYYYLPSFRKDVPNAGSLLLARIVEAACVGGCAIVDLLRGDHGYKRAWTNRSDIVYEVVWPSTLLGRVATLAYAIRWQAARSQRLRDLRARLRRVGDRRQSSRGKEMTILTQRVHVGERAHQ
jgi:CelD/BcsL family acetyltransferase involved in cellulose biosynthesis